MAAHARAADDDGAAAAGDRVLGLVRERADEGVRAGRLHGEVLAVGRLGDRVRRSPARSRDRARSPAACCSLSTWGMTIGPPERLARVLGQQHRVAGDAGAVADRLDDGAEIADRDALAQQRLQDALDLADGEQVGHDLLDDSGVGFLEPVEQRANILSREQIGHVAADRLGEVRDDDRLGVDHRVAEGLGLGAGGVGDPHRRQPVGGLGGRDAGELADRVARVEGELVAGHDRAAGDLVAAHLHHVLVRAQRRRRRGCARAG